MKRRVGFLFWLESFLAGLTLVLALLTLVWDDWIEHVFGFDPDQHNGSFELELTIVCLLITIVCGVLARREWRRAALAT
ncbi:MAG TPA: hypothetical protein VHX62_07440 [Solirubrobacteraceae bacterium]|nr:hypothetical protein [Solirubrobacteraceae bacterium]